MGIFGFFKKTGSWWDKIKSIFSNESSNFDEILQKVEETLILGDVGVQTTQKIINKLKDFVKSERRCTNEKIYNELEKIIQEIFDKSKNNNSVFNKNGDPNVLIFIGVNGVGKTTTIAKIANMLKKKKKKVVVGAGDTFRAAAVQQIKVWCDKIDVPLISIEKNPSPASVAFETIKYAKQNNYDIAIIDTAGRLQNKAGLMDELGKMYRVIEKNILNKNNIECWLVLDGATGANAFQQVEDFNKKTKITGLIVTKADGISKKGFIIKIVDILEIPIKFIGTGEKIDDIKEFKAKDFINNLLGE